MYLSNSVRHLQTLLQSFHPVIVIETLEEERVHTLLKQATSGLELSVQEWSIAHGLMRSPGTYNAPWVNDYTPIGTNKPVCVENTTDPLAVLQHIQNTGTTSVFWLKDFAKHLEDAATNRQFREIAQLFSQKRSAIVLSGESIDLPIEIAYDAVFVDLKLPDRDELTHTVTEVIREFKQRHRIQIDLQEQDLNLLIQSLSGMTLKQARQTLAYAALEDGKLTAHDIPQILQRKAQVIRNEGVLEYLPAQGQEFELGGFDNLKRWLDRAKVGFSDQAKALNLSSPKGILIVGIQGCGKSLAAKVIAQEWKMPLLKLDAGRLYDKYVGESEKNFRKAIKMAESMAPSVLWIDEIEKSLGAPKSNEDSGLSQRMFGSFLTWMQEKSYDVFVIATANDISGIPPELMRKGRFDEVFFVDLPDSSERETILKIHLSLRKQNLEHLDIPVIIQETEGFSGAEIEQVVIASLYRALHRQQPLDTIFLLAEIRGMIPLSVSRREHLQALQAIAKERFVSVK
jgi:MoxR-like ATPase